MIHRIATVGLAGLLSTLGARAALTTDLVAYYDFEDLGNDPAATGPDLTESGTGSYTGVAGGRVGNAAEFTGTTGDRILAPLGFGGAGGNQLGDSFTVSVWYQLDPDAASEASRFFVYEGDTDYDISYGLRDRAGSNGFNDSQTYTNGLGSFNHDDVHTPGEWQNVLMTYESDGFTTTVTTYIDGVQAGQLSGATESLQSAGINIGNARNTALNRAFDGKIDEFVAWSRVLGADEISMAYQLGLNGMSILDAEGYFVSATSEDPLTGSVTGGGLYASGTETTITAIPAPGYVFVEWLDDFAGQPASFTLTVTGDAVGSAIFDWDLSDPDGDNLVTYDEVVFFNTDPNDPDTDGDEIPDGDELDIYTDPLVDDSALVAFVRQNLCEDRAGVIRMSGPAIDIDPVTGEIVLTLEFHGSSDRTTFVPLVPQSLVPLADGWEVTLPAPSSEVDSYLLIGDRP